MKKNRHIFNKEVDEAIETLVNHRISSEPGYGGSLAVHIASLLPLIDELTKAGFPTTAIGFLQEYNDYRKAIPILLHWLTRIEDRTAKVVILKKLGVSKEGKQILPVLLEESAKIGESERFSSASVLWQTISSVVSKLITRKTDYQIIEDLFVSQRYGLNRGPLIEKCASFKVPQIDSLLLKLLDYEHIQADSLTMSQLLHSFVKRKTKEVLPKLSVLKEEHPIREVRETATMAFAKLSAMP